MNYLKRNSLVLSLAAMVLAVFVSCGDDSGGGTDIQGADDVKITGVNVTAFTASVSGKFSGLSKVDLALGKSGVLYCEKTDNASNIFKSWQEGNDNPDCILFDNGKVSGETYSGTIGGLYPDTEYSFCLFLKNKDNTDRKISTVQTFRTLPFNPVIQSPKISNIHYIDALANVGVAVDEKDVPYCKKEMLVSETSDGKVDGSVLFPVNDIKDGSTSAELIDIMPNKDYYCRLYMEYEAKDGRSVSVYGPETTFRTKDLMDIAVDLGLPSGVRWADFSMYEYEFASQYEMSPLFFWGSSRAMFPYLDTNTGKTEVPHVDYEHVDSNGGFKDLGHEISGTEYDVVHQKYGGKWRMPTKDDLEELIANCTLSGRKSINRNYPVKNRTVTSTVDYFEVIGKKGNFIKFRGYDSTWSGTMNDDNAIYGLRCRFGTENRMEIASFDRNAALSIRPVWDPNMQ